MMANNDIKDDMTTLEPRMTKALLKKLCRKHQLYLSPALNDVLFLHYQGFSKIENLEEYINLKCLWLQNNNIGDVSTGLQHLTSLRALHLHNNRIQSLKGLDQLTSLVTLNLCHNSITWLDGIDRLPHLQTLQLSHNRLRDTDSIRQLTQCPALSCVDVSHNRLQQPDVADVFACMPQLRVLQLQGNPCVLQVRQYRNSLTARCPLLTYLDDRPVFPVDRAAAEAWAVGGEEAERETREQWIKIEQERVASCVNDVLRLQERVRKAKQNRSSPSDPNLNENQLLSNSMLGQDSPNDDGSTTVPPQPAISSDDEHQEQDQGSYKGFDELSGHEENTNVSVPKPDQMDVFDREASSDQLYRDDSDDMNVSTCNSNAKDSRVWTQDDMGIYVEEYGNEKIYALTPEAKQWAKKKIEMMKLRDKAVTTVSDNKSYANTYSSVKEEKNCDTIQEESLKKQSKTIGDARDEDLEVLEEMTDQNSEQEEVLESTNDVTNNKNENMESMECVHDDDNDNCEGNRTELCQQETNDEGSLPSSQEYNEAFVNFLKSISSENSILLKQAIANVSGKSSFDEENTFSSNDESSYPMTEENTKTIEKLEAMEGECSEPEYSYDWHGITDRNEGSSIYESSTNVWDTIKINCDDSAQLANSVDSDIVELIDNLETLNSNGYDETEFNTAKEVENHINESIDVAKSCEQFVVKTCVEANYVGIEEALDSDDDDFSIPISADAPDEDQSDRTENICDHGIDSPSQTNSESVEIKQQREDEKCAVVAKNIDDLINSKKGLSFPYNEETNPENQDSKPEKINKLPEGQTTKHEFEVERLADGCDNEQGITRLRENETNKRDNISSSIKLDEVNVGSKAEVYVKTENNSTSSCLHRGRPIGCKIRNDCTLCGKDEDKSNNLSQNAKMLDSKSNQVANVELQFEINSESLQIKKLDDGKICSKNESQNQLKMLSEVSIEEIREDFRNVLQDMEMKFSGRSLEGEMKEKRELIEQFPLLTSGADSQRHSNCINEGQTNDGIPLTNLEEIHLLSKLLSCDNPDGTYNNYENQSCSENNIDGTKSLSDSHQISEPKFYGPSVSSNRHLEPTRQKEINSNPNIEVKIRGNEEVDAIKTLKLPDGRTIENTETAGKSVRHSVKLAWPIAESKRENSGGLGLPQQDTNDEGSCNESSKSCLAKFIGTKKNNVNIVDCETLSKQSSDASKFDSKLLNKRGRASNSFTRGVPQEEKPCDLLVPKPPITCKSPNLVSQTDFIYEEKYSLSPGRSEEPSGSSLFPKLVDNNKACRKLSSSQTEMGGFSSIEESCANATHPVEASKELLKLENVLEGKDSRKHSCRKIVYHSLAPRGKISEHQAASSDNLTVEQRQRKNPSEEGMSTRSKGPLIQELN